MSLAERAREAPSGPGVYFLLGDDRELLYVGKASSLRRRLLDYSRGADAEISPRLAGLIAHVRNVRWTECDDERDALCREADLIVGLAPRFNAVMAHDAYTYVCVDSAPEGRIRLALTHDPDSGSRLYGAFPHLGKGKHSWRAVRSNGGYSALVRLMWMAFCDRSRIPAKLRGTSPPIVCDMTVDAKQLALLHDFLSGRSRRLLAVLADALASDEVPVYMRRPLSQDVEAAEEFYRLGPHALRALRLRNGLAPGPVDHDTFSRLMSAEAKRALGDFTIRSPRGEPGRSSRRRRRDVRRPAHLRQPGPG